MSITATGEEPIEYGYTSNHWLASVLVNHAPEEHLATALKALLAQCTLAERTGDQYLSIEVVREAIVQILATGLPTVHTGINTDEEDRLPQTFSPAAPKPKTYDAAKVDAMLDEYLTSEKFAQTVRDISGLAGFNLADWSDEGEPDERDVG